MRGAGPHILDKHKAYLGPLACLQDGHKILLSPHTAPSPVSSFHCSSLQHTHTPAGQAASDQTVVRGVHVPHFQKLSPGMCGLFSDQILTSMTPLEDDSALPHSST